ncbi:Protein SMG7 [Colletotrichum plurivorum]|uniref:Nonsense-mediated mRNA decay factor n=1 Tax=Colletotrichum plurivorum TaxID=2175906 RepID=A0A8H6K549_9PEZI|nr:Protein SMG7 [Colletotrichum plurivorum]
MEDHIEAAKQAWHHAQKVRKLLQKDVEKLKSDPPGKEQERFEALEKLVSALRLACINVIFHAFEYAATEKVDGNLWQAHALINSEYRKTLARLKSPQHVTKRKLDKMYGNFLKTAQSFYIAYIQRLAAACPIPELLRIAEGIKAENLAEENPMANVTAPVRQSILKFCHAALIHLGDLSRYRTQARPKVPYEAALTYYSLAHDIIPTSGYAHHQMGIIYLTEKKHLDIIYHFYRAIAIEEPHPIASQNLESELKDVVQLSSQSKLTLQSTSGRRTGPPDPQDPFMLWFVTLHAYFYKGEPFTQHKELEDEVISRLEMAIKATNTRDMLQKMVLLNISAFQGSVKRMNSKWTAASSMSSQFILRLNARFFVTFCRLLKKELEDVLERQQKGGQALVDGSDKQADKVTPLIENTLPFVRLYAAWMVACRAEILNAQDSLGAFIKDMLRGFAKTLTVLCEVYGLEALMDAPYLLPEDHEAVGLIPLYDAKLPESCRLHYNEGSQVLKPQAGHISGPRLDALDEAWARVLGTIKCGFFLANSDSAFPYSYASTPKGLQFEFVENYDPKVPNAAPASIPPVEKNVTKVTAPPPPKVEIQAQAPRRHVQKAPSRSSPSTAPPQVTPQAQEQPTPGRNRTQGQSEYDFSSDTDMLNMVNDFLMPPTANHESPETPEDASYGMHSATANDLFGVPSTTSPPAVTSATSKAFPSLPWNMIYTPTPHSKNSELTPPNPATSDSAARQSFDGDAAKRNVSISGTNYLDDPFADEQNTFVPQQLLRYAGTPEAHMTAHQDRLLQAFGKQPDARPMSREYSGASGGYGLWPSPYGEGNTNALQPRAASTHIRSMSGSRYQYPQSPNVPQVGENFPVSSGTQFSNASSVYQSTPCNGITYTATTAFGRGPIAHMQEDPTHYKNLVRNNGGAATDGYTAGYNDMILQAAMADEMRRASGQNPRR